MKKLLGLSLVILMGVSAQAQDRQLLHRSTDEMRAAQEQISTAIRQTPDANTRERLRYAQDRVYSAQQLVQRFLEGGGGSNPNPPPYAQPIELYKSDTCNGELIATLRNGLNCSAVSTASIWAFKMGSTCHNIADMSGADFCKAFSGLHSSQAVYFYKSDTCSTELTGVVDRYTDCSSLPNKSVWAIKVNGTCQNITDVNMPNACERFKP